MWLCAETTTVSVSHRKEVPASPQVKRGPGKLGAQGKGNAHISQLLLLFLLTRVPTLTPTPFQILVA